MMPEAIRPLHLKVDEAFVLIPLNNFCCPVDGKAMDFEAILKDTAPLNARMRLIGDAEIEPRGSDAL
jgi:hypothetical protein